MTAAQATFLRLMPRRAPASKLLNCTLARHRRDVRRVYAFTVFIIDKTFVFLKPARKATSFCVRSEASRASASIFAVGLVVARLPGC